MSIIVHIFIGENHNEGDVYPFVRKVFLERAHAEAYAIASGHTSWHDVEVCGAATLGQIVTVRGEGQECVSQIQNWNGKPLSEQIPDYFEAIKRFRAIELSKNEGENE